MRFNGSTYRNPPKRQRTIGAVALRREVCSVLVEKIVVKKIVTMAGIYAEAKFRRQTSVWR